MTDMKPRQESVVVGVDGSPANDEAVSWAVRYATTSRRPVSVVTGAGDPRASAQILGSPEARRILRTETRRVTDHALGLVGRSAPGLDVDVMAPLENERQALIDLSHHAFIIVVGTRGHGPVRSLLLGSISAAVASHAACPRSRIGLRVREPVRPRARSLHGRRRPAPSTKEPAPAP